MTNQKIIERLVYGLVIVLSIVAVALAYFASPLAIDTKILYQGF